MRSDQKYNIAVVGATGAVGTEMLKSLAQRRFPVDRLKLLASKRSAGRRLAFGGERYKVEELCASAFEGIDLALFTAGAARSKEFAPEAVKRGAMVIDNSSAFRMDADVPLVVPEINARALETHKGIIANPNCSTIIMLLALSPLHQAVGLKRIVVSTYQSVSGAGTRAMLQLFRETQQVLRRCRLTNTSLGLRPVLPSALLGKSPLPAQIAFNVVPQIDVFLEDHGTKEELKMVQETRKILGAPELAISATCVRVPVYAGHAEAVWIETRSALSPEKARELLKKAKGVRVVDQMSPGGYPMPIHAAGSEDVWVGRLRKDASVDNGLALWICGDNLLKGAATNAVQIAEALVRL